MAAGTVWFVVAGRRGHVDPGRYPETPVTVATTSAVTNVTPTHVDQEQGP
jgi:hypothetical protein